MRTTVTLDADVKRLLRDVMRERGISVKRALNQAAREGLVRARQPRAKRFLQKTYAMGLAEGVNLDKALSLADAIERQGTNSQDAARQTLVHPGSRHFSILRELLVAVGTGGNLTSDAHLAALAIEHGADFAPGTTISEDFCA